MTNHDPAIADPPSRPAGQVLSAIGEQECFELLAGQNLGRLAVIRDGRPEIFPVNYALDDRTVVIRTAAGVKLDFGSFSHVALEVEQIDTKSREGWVVVLKGFAEEVTDAGDTWSVHAREAARDPWVQGDHEHFLAISHAEVSGRRLSSPPSV
jgi:nitroimidazol reductase NimA-like FMN-containing flavoprotein (pyridoxamine 5'-phosphate oxidase superfamily)